MAKTARGSIHLFNIIGIDVFLHWSWFLVAVYQIQGRISEYTSILWNVLEYFSLFLIILLHEFGHALACRQTGGQANRIVLWPLGGIAYVSPPQRPGAMLWSIAAGPLVNVALLPVLSIIVLVGRAMDWNLVIPNAHHFFFMLWFINLIILIFNLLPIYPLDGGQILRSLLWFVFGRTRSLTIAAVIGLIGVGGMFLLAFWIQSFWFAILAGFALFSCWGALKHARTWAQMAKFPRREGFACPSCKTLPPQGSLWTCSNCRNPFDLFETLAHCPHCRSTFSETTCQECNTTTPLYAWNDGE